jgi:hypothetical protein
MTLSSLRRLLYALARFLGDVQAIRKGLDAMVKGLARRQAWRLSGRVLQKLFR